MRSKKLTDTLTLGRANDPLRRAIDRLADRIVRVPVWQRGRIR